MYGIVSTAVVSKTLVAQLAFLLSSHCMFEISLPREPSDSTDDDTVITSVSLLVGINK